MGAALEVRRCPRLIRGSDPRWELRPGDAQLLPARHAFQDLGRVGGSHGAEAVFDQSVFLAPGNRHFGIAQVNSLGVLGPHNAQDVDCRGRPHLEGHIDTLRGYLRPRQQAELHAIGGQVQPDENQPDGEGDDEEAHHDVAPDGASVESVPGLHLRGELVPAERTGHEWETNRVSPLRLMAVHAHPDDEASKGAATTAKYVDEGMEVMVVTCTGGERGDVLNTKVQELVDLHGLSTVRQQEMKASVEVLGIQHVWLGFEDSGFPEGDPKPPLPTGCFADLPLEQTVPRLVEVIREFRPHVITTYDENGGYPHPDHIRTHEITMAAVKEAADPELHTELNPNAHQVAKVYYNQQFTKKKIMTVHQAMRDAGLESPFGEWITKWSDREDRWPQVTTRVDAADYFHIRDAALLAHATQIDPEGFWFAVPRDLQRSIWPTEEFELAFSTLPPSADPARGIYEDDLFTGLRG